MHSHHHNHDHHNHDHNHQADGITKLGVLKDLAGFVPNFLMFCAVMMVMVQIVEWAQQLSEDHTKRNSTDVEPVDNTTSPVPTSQLNQYPWQVELAAAILSGVLTGWAARGHAWFNTFFQKNREENQHSPEENSLLEENDGHFKYASIQSILATTEHPSHDEDEDSHEQHSKCGTLCTSFKKNLTGLDQFSVVCDFVLSSGATAGALVVGLDLLAPYLPFQSLMFRMVFGAAARVVGAIASCAGTRSVIVVLEELNKQDRHQHKSPTFWSYSEFVGEMSELIPNIPGICSSIYLLQQFFSISLQPINNQTSFGGDPIEAGEFSFSSLPLEVNIALGAIALALTLGTARTRMKQVVFFQEDNAGVFCTPFPISFKGLNAQNKVSALADLVHHLGDRSGNIILAFDMLCVALKVSPNVWAKATVSIASLPFGLFTSASGMHACGESMRRQQTNAIGLTRRR